MAMLKRSLNAAILLCSEYCVIPLGFYFECTNTKRLIHNNFNFVTSGLLRISLREEDVREYIEKKQKQLMEYSRNADFYKGFYDDLVIAEATKFNNALLRRKIKVGDYCIDKWQNNSLQYKECGAGDLAYAYQNIPDTDSRLKLVAGMDQVAEQTRGGAFVWTVVKNKLDTLSVSDKSLRRNIRAVFEKYYYAAYLEEYDADILENIFQLDHGEDFSLHGSGGVSNYGWFEEFLRCLKLERILEAPDNLIVELKYDTDFIVVLQKYLDICNDSLFNQRTDSIRRLTASELHNDLEFAQAVTCIKDKKSSMTLSDKRFIEFYRSDLKGKMQDSMKNDKIDVLIMIATDEEEKAILNNDDWDKIKLNDNVVNDKSFFTYYVKKEGGVVFALARAISFRESNTTMIGQYFYDHLRPRYIAMTGFCAGREGSVHLGDVVVPDIVYKYGEGKRTDDSQFLPETNSYTIDPHIKQQIERFPNEWIKTCKVIKPVDYEKERYEFLKCLNESLKDEIDPRNKWNSKDMPDIPTLIKEYEKKGWLNFNAGKIRISDEGMIEIPNTMTKDYWIGFQEHETKVVIGSMATGNDVQMQTNIFQELQKSYDRKTIAIDMESHGIGNLAQVNNIKYIIAKGVGDFAGTDKHFQNRYIEYACHCACRFLIEFFKHMNE